MSEADNIKGFVSELKSLYNNTRAYIKSINDQLGKRSDKLETLGEEVSLNDLILLACQTKGLLRSFGEEVSFKLRFDFSDFEDKLEELKTLKKQKLRDE